MKNILKNRILTTLTACAVLLAVNMSVQAADWGSGKSGQNAGQKTQDVVRKAYEKSKSCAKEFSQGIQSGQSSKSKACESAGAQTRKVANEAAGFVKGLVKKK